MAGYDVSRLLVGSLGTLALLSEISLKVLPQALSEATLCFELDQASALAHLHRWGAQPLPLNASCWVRDDTVAGSPELLFVRLRGATAAVESACQTLLQGTPGSRIDKLQAGADWAACRDQQLPFFDQATHPDDCLWRLSVPQTTAVLNLPWPQLVEWHGGQRWLWAPLSAQGQLRQAALESAGHATLFRVPHAGAVSISGRFTPLEKVQTDIHQRLKAEFDPAGIFNPGRLYPGW
ncbi:glycolate oxidase FAD binding subunit [mine drainage metagenome]|uniref:Glycolate oxidase FAD binding subunit n=1 Tax=mine drainage metagenome TaxID=410659 RepID=A0A1J5P6R5_9ZZZZ